VHSRSFRAVNKGAVSNWADKAESEMSISKLFCLQQFQAASVQPTTTQYNGLLKMATLAFIPYVPKVAGPKASNRPLSKTVCKHTSTFDSQRTELSAVPVEVTAEEVGSTVWEAERDVGARVQGMLQTQLIIMKSGF
jgi:hypothetical protein